MDTVESVCIRILVYPVPVLTGRGLGYTILVRYII